MSNISLWNPWRAFPKEFIDFGGEVFPYIDDVQMDVYETKGIVTVKIKAPNFKSDDFDIDIKDNILTITGNAETDNEEEDKDKKYYRREIRKMSFTRSVDLPFVVTSDDVKATYKDGILQIELPKSTDVKPKKISVKSE